jgi:hypothetical protein
LIVKIISEDLVELNKSLKENFEHNDTHPEYIPHCTLAYVKKDSCDDLLGQPIMPEKSMGVEHEFVLNEFKYSSPSGKKYSFELNNIESAYMSTEIYDGSEEMSYSQDIYFPKSIDNLDQYLYDENFVQQIIDILKSKGYDDVDLKNIYDPELKQQVNVIINDILQQSPSRSSSNNVCDYMPPDIDLKHWTGILK